MSGRPFLPALVACLALAACNPPKEPVEIAERLEERAEREAEASTLNPAGPRHATAPYLGEVRSRAPRPPALPARVETSSGFSLAAGIGLLPTETGARITEATGLPVVIDLDPAMQEPGGLPPEALPVRYTGPLSGFLNLLARQWDAHWAFDDGIIRIANAVTRSYEFRAPVASSQFQLQASESSSNTGSTGTSMAIESAFWTEIESTLASLVQPGRFRAAPGSGLVTVTAPPSAQRRVEAFAQRVNDTFDARIALEIVAAFLDVSGLTDHGISLSLLRTARAYDTALRFGRERIAIGGDYAAIEVLTDAVGELAEYSGSALLLQALARANRVIDYRTATAVTRHGSPVPIRLARKRDIVRSVSVVVADGVQTTSVESETLNTGLAMSAYPRILDRDRVHLTLSVAASDLVDLTTFQAGESGSIQLATVDERRLTHDLILDSRETLLLAGYEQERAEIAQDGTAAADFPVFGGGVATGTNRARLFLIVSARVLR